MAANAIVLRSHVQLNIVLRFAVIAENIINFDKIIHGIYIVYATCVILRAIYDINDDDVITPVKMDYSEELVKPI